MLARDFGISFLGEVPFDPRIARSGDSGIPFVAMHQETATGEIFQRIVHELLTRIKYEKPIHAEREGI
jgi:hypothetical protein